MKISIQPCWYQVVYMETLHTNPSLQERETHFNYLVILSSSTQCSTVLLVFHLLLSSWPLTGPSRSHHGLSRDQQHVLLALRCYKRVLFGRWHVLAVRLLELFQWRSPLGFFLEVLSNGLNLCTKTKQFIAAKMLLMFTGAVAVSPVFTLWPSLDPASMMGWFTALCTPTHLPFNLQNYLSPPLFLSLHFCPPPSSPTTSTFWYSFLQCQLEPLSPSINSLCLTLSQTVNFWWEATQHCTVWSGVVE